MIHNVVILLRRINYCSGRNLPSNSQRNSLVASVKIDRVRAGNNEKFNENDKRGREAK